MIIGNKNTIAFCLGKKNRNHMQMNIFFNNFNLNFKDNSYYYPMFVYNIEKELSFLLTNDLTLKNSLKNESLDSLFDLFQNFEISPYQSEIMVHEILGYDLSVNLGYFFCFEQNEHLIIFGNEPIFKGIKYINVNKSYYINLLDELINKINSMADC